MSLKDLAQNVVLESLENPKKRKNVEELGDFGKRLCLNGSIYQPFINYHLKKDTWKQVDAIKKKMSELNDKKAVFTVEQMESYGLDPSLVTKDIKASGQVLNDFLSFFENLVGSKYPLELAYYLSLSNDKFIIKYALSLLNQLGKSLENCLMKGAITQELYDQVTQEQKFQENNPMNEFQGSYAYSQEGTGLSFGDTVEYFPSNSVLVGLKRYSGMGWTLRLSCFLNLNGQSDDRRWFLHMYDGSSGIDIYRNRDKLSKLKGNEKHLYLLTFQEALDVFNQDDFVEAFMNCEPVYWFP